MLARNDRSSLPSGRWLTLGLVAAGVLGCEGLAGLDEFVDQDGGTSTGTASSTGTGQGGGTTTGTGQGGATGTGTGQGGGGTGGSGGDPCASPLGTPGLSFYSTLDDADSILNPAHGKGTNAVVPDSTNNPFFVTARCGFGARFDEADEIVRVPNQIGSNEGTITFWLLLHPQGSATERRLFANTATGNVGLIRLRLLPTGEFTILQVDSGGASHTTTVDSDSYIPTDTWVHVRVTWNATTVGQQMVRVYFNGTQAGYGPAADGPIDNPESVITSGMTLGGWGGVSGGAQNVTIDEFATYSVVVPP